LPLLPVDVDLPLARSAVCADDLLHGLLRPQLAFSLEEARRERDRDQKNAKNKHSRNILNANGK
jgi:hypothetical protein